MTQPSPQSRAALFQHLVQLGIVTQTFEHAAAFTVEQAKQVHSDIAGGHCKNIFCKDEKGVLWLIVALEDSVINLKTAPQKIGSKRLTFGKPELLMEILGVAPGSVSPFGLINDREQRTNVILDATMMREKYLNFHPLENTATTTISSDDLLAFIRSCGHAPRIVQVSELG
jgi:Ala-tRNA(Pro) deacylase